MNILFLTDNFPPEVNAPASRTYDHCREWIKKGANVTVITCAPNFPKGKVYDGYKNKLYQTEVIDGIKVIRVWSYIATNKGFLKRTLDYISYSITSFFAGLFVKNRLDYSNISTILHCPYRKNFTFLEKETLDNGNLRLMARKYKNRWCNE